MEWNVLFVFIGLYDNIIETTGICGSKTRRREIGSFVVGLRNGIGTKVDLIFLVPRNVIGMFWKIFIRNI